VIIDSHQHVFWHGRDDAGLIADMDEHGIDVAWLLTWEIPPCEDNPVYHAVMSPCHVRADGTHAGLVLADLLRAREHYPGRFVLGYCPNPALAAAPALFEAAWRIHGVRVCGEWKYRMLLDDPRNLELCRVAGRLGAPVVLHLDVPYRPDEKGKPTYQREWYGGTVADLERAVRACPETNFIAHGPGFWREISGDAESDPALYPAGPIAPGGRLVGLFDRHANLYADLSAKSALNALQRDPQHAKDFLSRFADRLLFGRDGYGQELHQFLQTLDLPAEVTRKIYCDNARRLVPLDA